MSTAKGLPFAVPFRDVTLSEYTSCWAQTWADMSWFRDYFVRGSPACTRRTFARDGSTTESVPTSLELGRSNS